MTYSRNTPLSLRHSLRIFLWPVRKNSAPIVISHRKGSKYFKRSPEGTVVQERTSVHQYPSAVNPLLCFWVSSIRFRGRFLCTTDEVKGSAAHSSQSKGRSILFSDQLGLVDDGCHFAQKVQTTDSKRCNFYI